MTEVVLKFSSRVFVLLLILISPSVLAEEANQPEKPVMTEASYGFHYDSVNDRYFTNGKSSFSIRPIEDQRYLDKIEVSIDGSDFSDYSGKLQFKTEGEHHVRFKASDPVLNWSEINNPIINPIVFKCVL